MKIQILAYAGRLQDKVTLTIDDNIEDEGTVTIDHRRVTLEYSESGLDLRAECVSLIAEDTTFNHSCTIYSGEDKLSDLDVINRIYPNKESK